MLHPKSVVVVEFESFEKAKRWYAAECAETIPLRKQAADSCLVLVDGLPATSTRFRGVTGSWPARQIDHDIEP